MLPTFLQSSSGSSSPRQSHAVGRFKEARGHEILGERAKAFGIYSEFQKDVDPKVAAEANYRMGKICLNDRQVRGIDYLRIAAQLGDVLALYELGICYADGNCVTKDNDFAILFLSKAAEYDHDSVASGETYFELGRILSKSDNKLQNTELAVAFFQRAADKGTNAAFYEMGKIHALEQTKEGCEKAISDFTYAVKLLKEAGEPYSEVLYELGVCYEKISGGLDSQAEFYYKEAADAPDPYPPASYRAGMLCLKNKGDSDSIDDIELAIRYFINAAQAKHPEALFELSNIYAKKAENSLGGISKLNNRNQSKAYLMQAAQAGHPEAQLKLATLYDQEATAAEINAEKNIPFLPLNTSSLSTSHSTSKSPREFSMQYYEEASLAGRAEASLKLGLIYKEGRGVPRDDEEARKYLKIAMSQGSIQAADELQGMGDSPWSFKKIKRGFSKIMNPENSPSPSPPRLRITNLKKTLK